MKELRGLDAITKQCHIVGGDCEAEDLGMCEEDRELVRQNVSLIYHMAATIRFDEEMKKAVLLNTRGTRDMLTLAKECKKLDMFAYISTSYCHLHEKLLMEKPYPPPADPNKIIKLVQYLDNAEVELMTKQILGDIPNTYAYTKSLAEALVNEAGKNGMPVMILRPSIGEFSINFIIFFMILYEMISVIPTWKEPIPGWTDNINGPTGLLIGAGKGVIRTMYCNPQSYGDFVPVDLAVNAVFVSTWNFIYNKFVHFLNFYTLKILMNQIMF